MKANGKWMTDSSRNRRLSVVAFDAMDELVKVAVLIPLLTGCGILGRNQPEPPIDSVTVYVSCPARAPVYQCRTDERPHPATLRDALTERERLMNERSCWQRSTESWEAAYSECEGLAGE